MSSERTGTIFIYMSTGQEVEISRVSYIPDCTSNLLLLLRLKETGISYHDGVDYIILKRGDKEVAQAKQSRHLLILKSIIISELVILASACRRPTYLEASMDIRQLWHRRFEHASHIRIEHLVKMVDGLQLHGAHPLENENISEDNQSDGILSDFLPE